MIRMVGWDRKSLDYHAVKSFVDWYWRTYPIDGPDVTIHAPERIYGLYVPPDEPDEIVDYKILLTLPARRGGLILTVAHELEHHRQRTSGRRLIENGVEARARRLVREWRRSKGTP